MGWVKNGTLGTISADLGASGDGTVGALDDGPGPSRFDLKNYDPDRPYGYVGDDPQVRRAMTGRIPRRMCWRTPGHRCAWQANVAPSHAGNANGCGAALRRERTSRAPSGSSPAPSARRERAKDNGRSTMPGLTRPKTSPRGGAWASTSGGHAPEPNREPANRPRSDDLAETRRRRGPRSAPRPRPCRCISFPSPCQSASVMPSFFRE